MKIERMIGALAPFLFVSTVSAYDVSITPGTGTIGTEYPPLVPVPEPNTAVLILLGIFILAALSVWHDSGRLKARKWKVNKPQ
jgi:hypothetical protein